MPVLKGREEGRERERDRQRGRSAGGKEGMGRDLRFVCCFIGRSPSSKEGKERSGSQGPIGRPVPSGDSEGGGLR